jgi:hypothetical protein
MPTDTTAIKIVLNGGAEIEGQMVNELVIQLDHLLEPVPVNTQCVPSHILERDEAMRNIIAFAGKRFREKAERFTLEYLAGCESASSETITDAARKAGIVPHDDRAFGPVYFSLSRAGKIVKAGVCTRRKGHGTSGGTLWRLA